MFDVFTHSLYVDKLSHLQDGANISILVKKNLQGNAGGIRKAENDGRVKEVG